MRDRVLAMVQTIDPWDEIEQELGVRPEFLAVIGARPSVVTPTRTVGLSESHVDVSVWFGLLPAGYLASLSWEERAGMWRRGLSNEPRPRRFRFVALSGDDVAGFILVGPAGADAEAVEGELYAINVDPTHWGAGAGPLLIDAGMSALLDVGFRTAILWVHPDNVRARRFYARNGWIDDGVERREEVLGVEVPETRLSLELAG